MIILAHNTRVTYSGIASALAARSGGCLIANIFCAIAHKMIKNYSDLVLTASFFLAAIGNFNQTFIR
jgi:hypothetical protein